MSTNVSHYKRIITDLVNKNRADFETAMRELQEEGLFAAVTQQAGPSTSTFQPVTSAPSSTQPPLPHFSEIGIPVSATILPSAAQIFAPIPGVTATAVSTHPMITRQRAYLREPGATIHYTQSAGSHRKSKKAKQTVTSSDLRALRNDINELVQQNFRFTARLDHYNLQRDVNQLEEHVAQDNIKGVLGDIKNFDKNLAVGKYYKYKAHYHAYIIFEKQGSNINLVTANINQSMRNQIIYQITTGEKLSYLVNYAGRIDILGSPPVLSFDVYHARITEIREIFKR